MAMINCPECGKEISELAEKCPNCGFPIKSKESAFYDGNVQKAEADSPYQQKLNVPPEKPDGQKKKNSVLGILALIFSILGCTFIVGIILAIIDLCKKDGKKKTCSIIALVICFIWIVAAVGSSGSSGSDSSDSSDNSIQASADESVENESAAPEAQISEPIKNEADKEDVAEGPEQQPEESAEISEISIEELKTQAQELQYKNMMRNPENYTGQYFYADVKIFTSESGGIFSGYDRAYKAFTNDEYDMWMGDMIYLLDNRDTADSNYVKILEDDIVRIYGRFDGLVETKNYLNNTKGEEMSLQILYAELISE